MGDLAKPELLHFEEPHCISNATVRNVQRRYMNCDKSTRYCHKALARLQDLDKYGSILLYKV